MNFTVHYLTSGTFDVSSTLYNLHSEADDPAAVNGFVHNSSHVVHVLMEVKDWELQAETFHIKDDGREDKIQEDKHGF